MADSTTDPGSRPDDRLRSNSPQRLMSLDAFRGFVILTMIFVNFLAGVEDIPAWAKHMPGTVDGFTFVDLVFPGFLFIVGVAIPLSIQNRRRRGDSLGRLVARIFGRAASLLFLGVILVNEGSFSAQATGMSKSLWYLLALVSVIVLWSAVPVGTASERSRSVLALKILAGFFLVYLLVIYRGKTGGGEIVWLRHSWWGILGLIGWAYLTASLTYLAVRGNPTALMGAMGFLISLYIGGRHGVLDWLGPVNEFVGVGSVLGSTSANVVAGVLVGTLFTRGSAELTAGSRIRFMAVFGIGLCLAATLLRPLHGIIKNQATDSYTLMAAGICCLLFVPFYWIIDIKGCRRWAAFLLPAGENPLLAYLLPDVCMELAGVFGAWHVLWPYTSGAAGAINAAVMTGLVLLINWVLTRSGVRLKM